MYCWCSWLIIWIRELSFIPHAHWINQITVQASVWLFLTWSTQVPGWIWLQLLYYYVSMPFEAIQTIPVLHKWKKWFNTEIGWIFNEMSQFLSNFEKRIWGPSTKIVFWGMGNDCNQIAIFWVQSGFHFEQWKTYLWAF